jgi:hypothetical protein
MGRSYTPKYRLEMDGATMCGWQVGSHYGIPGNGAPNDANLARYVEAYVASQDPGGANAHILRSLGHKHVPRWARIVRQSDGQVMASYLAQPVPLFQVAA